ncbi:hypothetical protein F0P96_09285 [Hymenobacter busanensis]|uniref:Uncharacterized protein n=1 Tax=Hymenobacter busanensis TaxID=2607656 RepID=A0A7L5A161_9BACT|nr:hypothetical protein [Hymenobacter busanensis]KAA9333162.1 hypothetical protein F0P96_09285 [Hymenobacter busanensis]QHJ08162.1 hypothetical protein GUY19_13040 [Hymenobacter busanensis]
MRITSWLLGAALLAAPLVATAQAPRRHFDAQGRGYYRGPARLTAGGGVAFYTGDLTTGLAQNRPGADVQVGVIYPWRPHWSVGGEFGWFQVGSIDQLAERNLAFRGRNQSLTSFLRFEPLHDPAQFSSTGANPLGFKPFLQAGLGLLLYNPKLYTGTEPLNQQAILTPERNDYPATAVVAPVGGGLSFLLNRRLYLTAQGTYFFTTTDHLDDVSQRGNPNRNDGYGLAELKVEYKLR